MADSAQAPQSQKDIELLPSIPSGQDIIKQIDIGIYKRLGIFLLASLIIAAALYVYLQFMQGSVVKQKVGDSQPVSTTVNTRRLQETQEQFSADQQRKNDVATINSALKSYFLEKKEAPDTLDTLVPDILPQLPTEPQTKGPYTYQPAQDKQSWSLTAILSDGTSFTTTGP